MYTTKIRDYVLANESKPKLYEQDYFDLAICEVILENYPTAKELFSQAVTRMFEANPYWQKSANVNWLVDITILSGRTEVFPSILEELRIYKLSSTRSNPVGDSPIAHYCYCVMEILYPSSGDIFSWIQDLLKRPKYKDIFAAGLTLQSIILGDQTSFTESIQMLLKAHEGKVKYGDLRWSPEGWLCLPAMTLSYLAMQKNLKVEINNDYFSLAYLDYLLEK